MASLDNSYNTGIVPPHLRTIPAGGSMSTEYAPTSLGSGVTSPYPNGSGLPPTPALGSGVTSPYPSGGGLPPTPVPPLGTGISQPPGTPPTPVPPLGTGISRPPGSPPTPVTPTAPVAGVPLSQPQPNAGNFGPVQTVQQALDGFINGKYAQNARLRGLEHANQRGMLNGSIAAGASQRAALESVQPFVSETMGFLNNREERALRQQLQNDSVLQQNWLQTQQFNNQFNAQLKMLPVTNSLQMLQALTQYAMNEPEVFTPQVMNGYTNFFNNNMLQLLKQYFPGVK